MQFLNSRPPSIAHECHRYKAPRRDCYELVVVRSPVQLPSTKWTHDPSSPRERIQKRANQENSKIPRSWTIHSLRAAINARADMCKNFTFFSNRYIISFLSKRIFNTILNTIFNNNKITETIGF